METDIGHIFGLFLNILYRAIMAKLVKMAKMTIMDRPNMAKNMANVGFHALSRTNVDLTSENGTQNYASDQKLWPKQNCVLNFDHFLCIFGPI